MKGNNSLDDEVGVVNGDHNKPSMLEGIFFCL